MREWGAAPTERRRTPIDGMYPANMPADSWVIQVQRGAGRDWKHSDLNRDHWEKREPRPLATMIARVRETLQEMASTKQTNELPLHVTYRVQNVHTEAIVILGSYVC